MIDMLPGLPAIDVDPDLERSLAEHDAENRARGVESDEWPEIIAETDVRSAAPSAHLIDVLESLRFDKASDAELLDAIVGWERVASYVAARQQRLIAAFAARRPDRSTDLDRKLHGEEAEPLRGPDGVPDVDRTTADELALELTVPTHTAERRLELALTLKHRLPRTVCSLELGKLTLAHAWAMADETSELTAAQADQVEQTAIERLAKKTPKQWRRAIKRVVHSVDADAIRKRRAPPGLGARSCLCRTPTGWPACMPSLVQPMRSRSSTESTNALVRLSRTEISGRWISSERMHWCSSFSTAPVLQAGH